MRASSDSDLFERAGGKRRLRSPCSGRPVLSFKDEFQPIGRCQAAVSHRQAAGSLLPQTAALTYAHAGTCVLVRCPTFAQQHSKHKENSFRCVPLDSSLLPPLRQSTSALWTAASLVFLFHRFPPPHSTVCTTFARRRPPKPYIPLPATPIATLLPASRHIPCADPQATTVVPRRRTSPDFICKFPSCAVMRKTYSLLALRGFAYEGENEVHVNGR